MSGIVQEYVKMFDENVPIWGLPEMTDSELESAIKNQIELGEPFKVAIEKGILY